MSHSRKGSLGGKAFRLHARRNLAMAADSAAFGVGLSDIAHGTSKPLDGAETVPEPWSARIQESIKISRAIRGGNFVQIATVDEEGSPHCRTVVFRGFLPVKERGGQEAMRMITDGRSEKVVHGRRSAACELVWWFSQSSEQFRIAGDLQFVGPESTGELQEARLAQWNELRDGAREQFWWDRPGVLYSGPQSPPRGGRGSDGEILPPPDCFLLVLLWPRRVKYLRLTDNYAQVDSKESASGQWTAARVNP